MRPLALLPVLLVAACAGCTGPAPLQQADLPMHWVASAYYDIDVDQTYLEKSVYHAGGGATSEGLRFHTFAQVEAHLVELNATYPQYVELRAIGTSREGRPMWDVVLTDETLPPEGKLAPVLDGAHHGNEYAGGEIMLYTADLILENAATNATVRALLRDLEIHIVPVVNPDGWEAATRYNAAGVNLNRNYDIDWGNPLGTSNPAMGAVGAASGQPLGGVLLAAENCGEAAFSEPETQAVRDLFVELGPRAAFYLTGHTHTHAVIAPWAAYEAHHELPAEHVLVFESELQWVRDHTEYQAGKAEWGNTSAGLPYAASGSSMDYFYVATGRPAFTVEVEYGIISTTDPEYPGRLLSPFDGLRYWMESSAPLPMHLLANAEALAEWSVPGHPALVPVPADTPAWLVAGHPEPHL